MTVLAAVASVSQAAAAIGAAASASLCRAALCRAAGGRRRLSASASISPSVSVSVSPSTDSDAVAVPVLIVGGGPSGLLLSALLSSYGTPSALLEARPAASVGGPAGHPQAHYLNLRTMEVLRHSALPGLHRRTREAMPPSAEWEGFGLGRSVLGAEGFIGRVVHPVCGLEAGRDGNGVLEPGGGQADVPADVPADAGPGKRRISPCDPGHLAQNRFSELLLEAAREAAASVPGALIRHGASVESVIDRGGGRNAGVLAGGPLEVRTECGTTYLPRVVVAADGAASPVRRSQGVAMVGDGALQHLVSIHFRTAPELEARLREAGPNMLHFTFHEKVVGCFVCHDLREGDWVLQVPYFAPFQTAGAFTEGRARELVLAGLGLDGEEGARSGGADLIEVRSVRPWTMGSTVAESYTAGPSRRIVLIGDAAHAFPPAGGFGMNTGLQDAHNLAWRLAHHLGDGSDPEDGEALTRSLHLYQSERRPIAAQNAALSVRNYQRTLGVARACYLDADHPALLIGAMSIAPLSLLPMEARGRIFDAAVRAATVPLAALARTGNPHGERIRRNVREKLDRGEGLPLLFPRYEVGFGYGEGSALGEEDDTAGYLPLLKVGRRLPHVVLEVDAGAEGWPKEVLIDETSSPNLPARVSATDIGGQMHLWSRDRGARPRFSLMHVCASSAVASKLSLMVRNQVLQKTGLDVDVLFVSRSTEQSSDIRSLVREIDTDASTLALVDPEGGLLSLLGDSHDGALVLIRPDGHVASIASLAIGKDRLTSSILSGIQDSL